MVTLTVALSEGTETNIIRQIEPLHGPVSSETMFSCYKTTRQKGMLPMTMVINILFLL